MLDKDDFEEISKKYKIEDYSNYSFWIPRFSNSLDINICAGNRGKLVLTNLQREKYFEYINSLFDRMEKNVLKV